MISPSFNPEARINTLNAVLNKKCRVVSSKRCTNGIEWQLGGGPDDFTISIAGYNEWATQVLEDTLAAR